MSKLPKEYQFIDLSDYGRAPARWIARRLKNTQITPIGVTGLFIVAGLLAIFFIYKGYYLMAAQFLIFKSILDAADGELARLRETPSFTGRYLDSVSDLILNALIFILIGFKTDTFWLYTLSAFLAMQLQGTLYNYWYVILRKKFDGEQTSRVFETKTPQGYPGENQKVVTFLFYSYLGLYGAFDQIIYKLDATAPKDSPVPPWLMTLSSLSGLGFQLLLIAIFLNLGWIHYIIPFFIVYSLSIPLLIIVRKRTTKL